MSTMSSNDDFVMVPQIADGPQNKISLDCSKEQNVVGLNGFTAHAALQLIAPPMGDDNGEVRSKVALTAVLDRSGSMNCGKLDLCKIAMHFVREQLQKDDLLGVVVYDHDVQEAFELTQALPNKQEFFAQKINEIRIGGTTNLSGGLFKGIEQQGTAFEKELIGDKVVQAILLCTDGHANKGLTDPVKISKIVKQQISDIPNVCVHTFGFGSDHNPEILKNIAEAGKGKYFYVDKDDSIPDAFGDALGGLQSVAAQNIRLVITPLEPSFCVVKIWDQVVEQQTNKDGVVSITLRDMISEIERKLLFEYSVGEIESEGEQVLALVELMYMNLVTGQNDKIAYTLKINRQKDVPEDEPKNEEVLENIARVKTTTKIQEALEFGKKGNVRGGFQALCLAKQELGGYKFRDEGFRRRMMKNLDELQEGFGDEYKFKMEGQYRTNMAAQCFSTQQAMYNPGPEVEEIGGFMGQSRLGVKHKKLVEQQMQKMQVEKKEKSKEQNTNQA